MNQTTVQSVQRTLVISYGSLAQQVREQFQKRVNLEDGPALAIGWVDATGYEQIDAVDTAVTQTVTQISPPDLAAQLAAKGWHLSDPTQLDLFLLVDAHSQALTVVPCLLERVSSFIYRQLGIEAAVLLLWLVGEDEREVIECLTTPVKTTRGTAVLGMRNEDGFRLSEETVLADLCAAMLWCLIATPLRHLPEQIIERTGEFYDETRLFTFGLHGWVWSAEATHTQFVRQWLEDIFFHWLTTNIELPAAELVATWMQQQRITPEGLTDGIAQEAEELLNIEQTADWQMPWPWHLAAQINQLYLISAHWQTVSTDFAEQADFQLADPIFDTTDLIKAQITSLLDQHPIGGICLAVHWVQTMIAECERQCDLLADKREILAQSEAQLHQAEETLKMKSELLLAKWPDLKIKYWLSVLLRPWRWPQYGWHYLQLRNYGQQLERILQQQAALAQQLLLNQLAQNAMRELIERLAHLEQQVTEIEEMIQFIARNVSLPNEQESRVTPIAHFLTQLPNPTNLYTTLVPDVQAEAILAAEAVGGLGQQVSHLDDAIIDKLWRVGGERLAKVWDLTAVDALTAVWEQEEEAVAHWEAAWSAACPLWRFDEAQLDEATRSCALEEALLCGANTYLLDGVLPHTEEPIQHIEATDKETLWLLRLRAGLTLVTPEQT